ncbi:MAG: glycosyltransferase family 2 protein [Chloroflexi bacterium]|nr:glycosyltransferase family 2 protein [Chloroflexota bacterium]
MIDLSIVIVNWNVKDLLAHCLESVFHASDGLEIEVIVVDNASTDGSPQMVRECFPQVQLVANERNAGFTTANNQGIATAKGRYILLLNPDTEVLDGALSTMVRYMDAHPSVGALGPRLIYPDGHVQSSRRRFPTLATAFLESTILQQWFPHNRILSRYYCLDRSDEEEQEVDWVVGACLMMRREALDQVGPLDEGFFMYSEEMDWCHRLVKRGWHVVYLPSARVVHYEGRSSSQVVPQRHIYFQSSKVYYFRKYFGLWGEILRWFLLGTYFYQMVLEGLKWLIGHKRSLRAERVRAYAQVLRSGLRTPTKGIA